MGMTGVYACLFEAVCDVTTVPSHLKGVEREALLQFEWWAVPKNKSVAENKRCKKIF